MNWSPEAELKPMHGTWYFRINATGEVAEVDVRVMRTSEWAEHPKSKDPLWCSMDFDGITIVVKAITDPPCQAWRRLEPPCDPP